MSYLTRILGLRIYFILGTALCLLSACDSKVVERSDASIQKQSKEGREACAKGECPCEVENLGTIKHGVSIPIYSKEEVVCTEKCENFAQTSTCQNGKMSIAPGNGKFARCKVSDCPSCTMGNNLIESGQSVELFSKSIADCGESCESFKKVRTCKLGKMLPDNTQDPTIDSYTSFNCQPKVCRCLLPDNSSFLSLGGKIDLYSNPQAACGTTCNDAVMKQNRVCVSSGSGANQSFALNGSDTYRHRTCNEATNCTCTLPNNLGLLIHGQTKRISSAPSVACGNRCEDQPSINVQCNNGIFRNADNLNQIVDFTTPAFQNFKYVCSVDQCVSCPVEGTSISVLHGQSYNFWKTPTVGCSANCESMNRVCNNGLFNGDDGQRGTASAFASATCSRRACACVIPGLSGVTVPVGNTRLFYSASQATCGSTCAQISQDKTCTEKVNPDGSFGYEFEGVATHIYPTCGPATNCSCALPNNLGTIENEKTVVLTSLATVPCGTTCAETPSVELVCKNGTLKRTTDNSEVNANDPAFPYRYFCKKEACNNCLLQGYGTIQNNSQVTLYSKNVLGCSDVPDQVTFQFSCENGVLLKNPAGGTNPPAWYTSYSLNCPGCPLPWGGTVGKDASVIAYESTGNVGASCGTGCRSEQRLCQLRNGVYTLTGSFTKSECTSNCVGEGGGALPRLCLLPYQNSYVTPGSHIPLFRKKSVGCNDSCANHSKVGECKLDTGTFNVGFEYAYPSCTRVCP